MDQVRRLLDCQARLCAGGTFDLLYKICAGMWYASFISQGDMDIHSAKNEWLATAANHGADVYESLALIVRDHGYLYGDPVRFYHEYYEVFDRVVKFLLGDETWDDMPEVVHQACHDNASKHVIVHMNICYEKTEVTS